MSKARNQADKRSDTYVFLPFFYGEKTEKGHSMYISRDGFVEVKDSFKAAQNISGILPEGLRADSWDFPSNRVDTLRYLHRYVSDKYDWNHEESCLCWHLMTSFDMPEEGSRFYIFKDNSVPNPDVDMQKPSERKKYMAAELLEAHIFLYRTGVGLAGLRIRDAEPAETENGFQDPREVAAFEHALTYPGRNRLLIQAANGTNTATCAWDILTDLLGTSAYMKDNFELCYHVMKPEGESAKSVSRADLYTFLYTDGTGAEDGRPIDHKKDLYFLRNAADNSYAYSQIEEVDKKEIYQADEQTVWGLTPEVVVCLRNYNKPDGKADSFCRKFRSNTSAGYLLLYTSFLHQKYALYRLLMRIGVSEDRSLEELTQYKHDLDVFKADYVYSSISDTPQYRKFYDRLNNLMELDALYSDANEPLASLTEQLEKSASEQEEQRQNRLNVALAVLAALGVFSALVDSFDFVKEFMEWDSTNPDAIPAIIRNWQIFCLVVIILIVVGAIWMFFTGGIKRKKKDDKK